ncbi:flavin reductase family protein [Acinetobacter vivianii]|uniref:flavin reductase family protein n=1 Tax=Acinetobacter vivianii TaxID=1776742 RepID=UPI002DB62921|nr:flavin reductase family protein [Acinetobacter vivianii]MEB6479152.1 flavin reductase family protein [Acinetobacter vivianii]MEB6657017.1 flavin reductase family protein [Acinetobacter vivianii]
MSAQDITAVELPKAYRLLNHGPTVLVSAQHEQDTDVMAAAWACALELTPAKVTVVLDKSTKTRQLVEQSGYFALQVPCHAQIDMVHQLGTISKFDQPTKLTDCKTELFYQDPYPVPLVTGSLAWLICKVIPEPHNQQAHDLFIGSVVAAWADSRVFRDGHWHFQDAAKELRSLHYIAGGTFYLIGDEVKAR